MDKKILESYKKSGNVLSEVRRESLDKIVRPGAKILDIAEFIEKRIKERGCGVAFPVNISINEIAAHYTPISNDETIIKECDLVKIDIGVQYDGYIADSAITYCSEKSDVVDCANKALNSVLKVLKPGLQVHEIGSIVQEIVNGYGLGLIVNLTGHMLDRNVFHGSPSIPNIQNKINYELKDGDVLAIEPFVVKSNGYVRETHICEIYRYLQDRPVRLQESRGLLEHIKKEYGPYPFAKRWLNKIIPPGKINLALKQLELSGSVEKYPLLKEVDGKTIAQAEHTVVIAEKPIITTMDD